MTNRQVDILRTIRARLSNHHLRECGFTLPGRQWNGGKSAEAIEEATRLYRESWILPYLDALIDGKDEKWMVDYSLLVAEERRAKEEAKPSHA